MSDTDGRWMDCVPILTEFESWLTLQSMEIKAKSEGAIKRTREDIKHLLSQKFDSEIDWHSNQSFLEQIKNKKLRK